ncbi:MAG: di-trans,poly-cis-decaprenylcistransferase [Pseudomonadales bacterium]|jgi:undecaprenyl diphosphate synthase|nr:di-trans,poly-cis-decaprenylcistransferase [Pseudomonadales bacterium]
MSSTIPKHVVLIPDGNRRWAKEKNLPVVAGHKKAIADVIPTLVEKSFKAGVKVFTVWLFSTENWQRDKVEVDGLMKLGKSHLEALGKNLSKNGIKMQMIGRRDNVPPEVLNKIEKWEKKTADNDKATMVLAFNYGGQDEIIRAVRRLAEEKNLDEIQNISPDDFAEFLDTKGLPDPDLIIRTSGENRLSGMLPWQSAYAELYFSPVLMPDFDEEQLQLAFDEYARRQRRFGA